MAADTKLGPADLDHAPTRDELRTLGLAWFAENPNRARQLEMAMREIERKADLEPLELGEDAAYLDPSGDK